ncbi:MAG: hypothetical protein ABIW76_23260, partial [Fibrobacteria bacterium]
MLLTLYLVAALASTWALLRSDQANLFHLIGRGSGASIAEGAEASGKERAEAGRFNSLKTSLLAAALAIYPLIYILALLHNIGELDNFSIRLPSDVYTDGLLWMAYATPGVGLAGLAAWRASLKTSVRTLIYFYSAVLVVLAWIMVWERLDLFLAAQLQSAERNILFFPFRLEQAWRSGVKTFFYASAFLLGTGYLISAPRTGVFAKRSVFLGLPSLLLYLHMLFVLGDWNYYLAGMRERCFKSHRFSAYRFIASAQLVRTPRASSMPAMLEEWAELEYQAGNRIKAVSLLKAIAARSAGKAFYSKAGKRAQRSLDALAKADSSGAPSGVRPMQLDLPIIKTASYLDQEWYALLSAVAFLKPSWTDLELKKRLLELSNTVQLHLPRLDNVPELIPALRQLDLPVTTCFLTSARLKAALAAGHVPFLSLYGHWVPISGFDPGRDGFYYYSYGDSPGLDWFR